VDIVCRTTAGELVGIQCKQLRDGASLARADAILAAEIEKAKTFDPPLQKLIVVTDSPNDVELQASARRAPESHATHGLFSVNVHGWDWVEGLLSRWPDIAHQYSLILQSAAEPRTDSVATALGGRFGRVIELINVGRGQDEPIGVTDIAQALSHHVLRQVRQRMPEPVARLPRDGPGLHPSAG
jgi:hypothetical protein